MHALFETNFAIFLLRNDNDLGAPPSCTPAHTKSCDASIPEWLEAMLYRRHRHTSCRL